MKANELRIGNYIQDYYNTKIFVVKTVDSTLEYLDLSDSKTHENHITNLKPIPLTEDILLNCGFEKAVDSNVWVCNLTRQTMFYELTFNSQIGASLYEDEHWIKSDIKYLHTLQNLYFALTGEELTIKL